MLDAGNIYIKLIPLDTAPDHDPQHINYHSLSAAVRDFESLRKHSRTEESGDFQIQLCCDGKLISQRYLTRSEYERVIREIDISNMHAA